MYGESKWQVTIIKDTEKLIWTNLLAILTLADAFPVSNALAVAFPVSSFGLTHFLEESPIPWNIGMRHINLNLSARRTSWHTTFYLGCYHSNIGRCFSSIFFWKNSFLGRVTHSLKYRHAAHQPESLGTTNQLAYNVWSWMLPIQHWQMLFQVFP